MYTQATFFLGVDISLITPHFPNLKVMGLDFSLPTSLLSFPQMSQVHLI